MSSKTKHYNKWTLQLGPNIFIWPLVLMHLFDHILAINGFYLMIFGTTKYQTVFFSTLMVWISVIGATVGAHRLWSHSSFKAKFPLRILIIIFQTISMQYSVHNWVRDHKMHHKFSDTPLDPHNSKNGFFFSHFGWLFLKKSPAIVQKARELQIESTCEGLKDPLVQFQKKYYWTSVWIISLIIPTLIPIYFWSELFWPALTANAFRHVIALHNTCLINSAAHIWGRRPYDQTIQPTENMFVSHAMAGEGYHNFHHAFPSDYSLSEHTWQKNVNLGTIFIDFFAYFGLVYDRKKTSKEFVELRKQRTGDHTIRSTEPQNLIRDYLLGFLTQSWTLWFPLLLRYFLLTSNNFN